MHFNLGIKLFIQFNEIEWEIFLKKILISRFINNIFIIKILIYVYNIFLFII